MGIFALYFSRICGVICDQIGQEWNSVVQTIERGRYQPVLLTYQRSDSTPIETGEENRNVNCNNATEDQYIALEDWGCYVSARPPNRSPDRTAYRRQLMSTSGKPEAKEIADLVALLADATIRDPRDAKVPATDIMYVNIIFAFVSSCDLLLII
jgi:hypothetical protein